MEIQDVGIEILGGNPKKFYIFCGSEYGIKSRYIDILKNHYGNYKEYDSVESVINLLTTKHLIPLQPTLYVVRYDSSFIKALSDSYVKSFNRTVSNISDNLGTLVCIYDSNSDYKKLSKHLSDYVVNIDAVNPRFLMRYITEEFPDISNVSINSILQLTSNYGEIRNICNALSYAPPGSMLTPDQIRQLVGISDNISEETLKLAIASKRVDIIINYINTHSNYDILIYGTFSILVELEKIKSTNYVKSNIKKYSNLWSISDVYNFYFWIYESLKYIRTSIVVDVGDLLVQIYSMLAYIHVPTFEGSL